VAAATASTICEPTLPAMIPSSAVTTSSWRAASAIIAGSRGLHTRTSQTVASMPSAARSAAAPSAASTILPTARMATDPDPRRAHRADRPEPTWSAGTWRAAVFGHRMAEGPSVIARASSNITSSSWAEEGAKTVMPGTLVSSAMSSTPWWLAPSSPVMPARSMQNTTGWPWRPTSRLTWSKARVTKVE
jgi:hypothetical protein